MKLTDADIAWIRQRHAGTYPPDMSTTDARGAHIDRGALLDYIDSIKPRTITTLEEWQALPYGAVCLGRLGEIILNEECAEDYGFMPFRLGGISDDIAPELPLIVLHAPEATA